MKQIFILLTLFALLALACNTSTFFATPTPEPTPTPVPVGTDLQAPLPLGDAARGEMLFNGQVNGQFACSACHGVFEGQVTTCPNIVGLATRAASRIPGYSAETYIRESIVSPNAYLVEGYTAGIMPQNFAETMTAQQLDDILAFLMTR